MVATADNDTPSHAALLDSNDPGHEPQDESYDELMALAAPTVPRAAGDPTDEQDDDEVRPYTEGWVPLMRSLLFDPSIGDGELRVLLALLSHRDEEGRIYPKERTLADELGCSERTVRERLRRLESLGMIAVRGTLRTNRYELLYPGAGNEFEYRQDSAGVEGRKRSRHRKDSAGVRGGEESRHRQDPAGSNRQVSAGSDRQDPAGSKKENPVRTRTHANENAGAQRRRGEKDGAPPLRGTGAVTNAGTAAEAPAHRNRAHDVEPSPTPPAQAAPWWWNDSHRQLLSNLYRQWPKQSDPARVKAAYLALGERMNDQDYNARVMVAALAYIREVETWPPERRPRFVTPLEKWFAQGSWEDIP